MEKEILDNNRKRPIELISAGNKRARLDRRNQKDRDRRNNESEDCALQLDVISVLFFCKKSLLTCYQPFDDMWQGCYHNCLSQL